MRFRAYYKDSSGLLSIGHVDVIDAVVHSQAGDPLVYDGERVELTGWPDDSVQSYSGGRVLVSDHALDT